MTEMNNFSVLIGGKAGFGIDRAGSVIAGLLNRLGYRVYIYRDYPSLIRGGHTFSIIRASSHKIACHQNKIDFLLALNQETFNVHKDRLKPGAAVIYDSDSVNVPDTAGKIQTSGIPGGTIIKEEKSSEIMRNSCIIGAFCKTAGISWEIAEAVLRKNFPKETDMNLKVARRGYDQAVELAKVEVLKSDKMPLVTGNEALGLGLVKGGLKAYISYPMTPSSGILHFLANNAGPFGLKVIHPESETGVILMALGFSYAGQKAAVGTSGGGFCLMTEGLSLSGMAELPVVIILGQRPGPSTGLPTYTAQTELNFAVNAGHGEFSRLVVAPGDAEEAYYWSAVSLNLAWRCQIPAIILSDKTLAEGTYNFDLAAVKEIAQEPLVLRDDKEPYKRYADTETGVSPLSFPPDKGAVIKVNSYERDENGITTEDPQITRKMQEKRLRKGQFLKKELEKYETVKVSGNKESSTAVLCWGSNKGVCVEAAQNLGLKVVQPVVIWPFPAIRVAESVKGIQNLICVENNAGGQLANLAEAHGIRVNQRILRCDGRPFALEEMEEELKNEQH